MTADEADAIIAHLQHDLAELRLLVSLQARDIRDLVRQSHEHEARLAACQCGRVWLRVVAA